MTGWLVLADALGLCWAVYLSPARRYWPEIPMLVVLVVATIILLVKSGGGLLEGNQRRMEAAAKEAALAKAMEIVSVLGDDLWNKWARENQPAAQAATSEYQAAILAALKTKQEPRP